MAALEGACTRPASTSSSRPTAAGRSSRRGGGPRRTRPTARASRTPRCATGSRGSRATATCAAPRTRPDESALDRLTRETIWRVVTPRWRRHLERLVERERPDAVLVFTVPMAHFRGIPTRAARALRHPGRLLRRRRADEPAGVRRHGHGLQLLPRRRSVRVRPRPLELRGRPRRACSSSARAARRRCFWGADPEFFAPQPVEKETDVFFYGYGDKFRREWMAAHGRRAEPARSARSTSRSAGATSRATSGSARAARRRAVQRLRAGDLGGADQPQRDAPLARDGRRLLDVPAVRARRGRRGDRLEPARRASSAGSSRAARSLVVDDADERARGVPGAARRPGARRRRWARARASASSTSTPTRTARAGCSSCSSLERGGARHEPARIVAIVPAYDEEGAIGGVVDEIRAVRPGDRRRRRRRRLDGRDRRRGASPRGAAVVRLPVQPRHRRRGADGLQLRARARLRLAVRLDGDGQHDPAELPKLLGAARARTRPTSSPARASSTASGELPAAARAAARDHLVRASSSRCSRASA